MDRTGPLIVLFIFPDNLIADIVGEFALIVLYASIVVDSLHTTAAKTIICSKSCLDFFVTFSGMASFAPH